MTSTSRDTPPLIYLKFKKLHANQFRNNLSIISERLSPPTTEKKLTVSQKLVSTQAELENKKFEQPHDAQTNCSAKAS